MFLIRPPTRQELQVILLVIVPLLAGIYYYFYYRPAVSGQKECQEICVSKGFENSRYQHPRKSTLGTSSKWCECLE
ncbi:MAG: hypothetical protein AAF402_00690 [Pseudomonadota bacterium]